MSRLVAVLRDPVAWILVVAGIVELASGGTVARGAILFAGAGLILADRVRTAKARSIAPGRSPAAVATVAGGEDLPFVVESLQVAIDRPTWMVTGVGVALVAAMFGVHTLPLTALTGVVGIAVVGWAWLTQSDPATRPHVARSGLLFWGATFLVLGLWELTALLGQPNLAETSYDHPTISYLLDPVLATYPGRAIGLGLWAAAGRSLIRRA
jgi:hypothetical protein